MVIILVNLEQSLQGAISMERKDRNFKSHRASVQVGFKLAHGLRPRNHDDL